MIRDNEGNKHVILMAEARADTRPALFLDRDGVLIEDRNHLKSPEGVRLYSGAKELIRRANTKGVPVIVVTNQSGIGRGYFSWPDYEAVSTTMLRLLGKNAKIAAIYANGYTSSSSPNDWRKPGCGMLAAAKKDLNIDLARSMLIGDRLTDLEAGVCADLAMVCHVLTGHGEKERSKVLKWWTMMSANQASRTVLKTIEDIESFRWLDHLSQKHPESQQDWQGPTSLEQCRIQ